MKRFALAIIVFACLFVFAGYTQGAGLNSAPTGLTLLLSITASGEQGNGDSYNLDISGDGKYVAFETLATNLVPGDANNTWDIIVKDRETGQIERVSVASNGEQANNYSLEPSISTNGRFISYSSVATNLVSNDNNGYSDAFLHDRQTDTTIRVSVSSSGEEGNGPSWNCDVSTDGNLVAFYSEATNLVATDTNGYGDIFVHNQESGQTELVSISSAGVQGNNDSYCYGMSADGRYIVLESLATNLVASDTNGFRDVFIHDRQTGLTELVSVSSTDEQGNGNSQAGDVSTDGRYVAFSSYVTNLVPEDTNDQRDAFIRDRQTGQTERISISSSGEQGNADSYCYGLSDDGRYVVFISNASNLVSGDTNGFYDVFVRDRLAGQTTRISVSSSGTQANEYSHKPAISANGRFIAFLSFASNLVDGDVNGFYDIFVRDQSPLLLFLPMITR